MRDWSSEEVSVRAGADSRSCMYYEYELGKASDVLVRTLFKLKEGETFIITADTESDIRVVNATARAAFVLGAKPMVIVLASPLGSYKGADPMLPVDSLTAALSEADAWVQFNGKSLMFSTPYALAFKNNNRLRHLLLRGMDVDMMVRLIGRVGFPVLREFLQRAQGITKQAKHGRITTPAGGDVEFDIDSSRPVTCRDGYADAPGAMMLGGQVGWAPTFESISGVIVYDGSVVPLGLLGAPIRLHIEKGEVIKVEGGREAAQYEAWLKGFNHPQMLKVAHVCYGFHPNARLTGKVVEDERVWGATQWGIGEVSTVFFAGDDSIPAPSHSDGICLNSSVWLDGEQILHEGKVVHKELAELARKMGK